MEKKLSYYLNKEKNLQINENREKLKIAIIGSFTLNGLPEVLKVKCSDIKINLEYYLGKYNQYNQEIIDSKSELYKFNPDLTFLILEPRTILGESFHFISKLNEKQRENIILEKFNELNNLIKIFKKTINSKLVITNLSIPVYSEFGIFEKKMCFSLQDIILKINIELENLIKQEESVYILDYDRFVRKYGEENIFDFKQYFFGDIKISIKFIPKFADEIMSFIKPVCGRTKKCIVLDLDQTLWGGIIGEDGYDGIKLGPDTVGRTFVEFQKTLLGLNNRGILLAINSKNNFNEAMNVIKNHPYMILKEENFASIQINWSDKLSNMYEISKELNVGLDSMVFFDDDPINRELIKKMIPEVLTVDLPNDPAMYVSSLIELNDFNVLKITDEDIKRNQMYVVEHKRNELKRETNNLENFLKELNIQVKIKKADDFSIPRITQLILKTNQFNLTTKRYQIEEINDLIKNPEILIGYAEVLDKFGDSGITGVFIIKKNKTEWKIDTFLLSCRVMGRGIEDFIISYILNLAKKEGVKIVRGEYIPTPKNKPAEDFLKKYGFEKNQDFWEFNLENNIKIPEHINVERYE